MITLYLGRHGETDLNAEKRLRGWIDEALNADGVKEAEAMAEKMKTLPIDRIYCSDLDRANETAQIVAKEHKLKPIPRQWFRPLNYGDLNGKPLKNIQHVLDDLNDIWKTDPTQKAPNGESFQEFQDRNLDGLAAILGSAKEDESIMIVAHLRNCLLFHSVAVNGGPLTGEAVALMAGKDYHQSSGDVAKFVWDGALKFVNQI